MKKHLARAQKRKKCSENVGQEKKKKKQQKLNSEGFLCVDSQEEIEIHYGRENNQEKITKTNKENLMLLRYHLIQCLTIQTEGKMARNIENHKSLPN